MVGGGGWRNKGEYGRINLAELLSRALALDGLKRLRWRERKSDGVQGQGRMTRAHLLRVRLPNRHRSSQLNFVCQRNLHLFKHVVQLLFGGFGEKCSRDVVFDNGRGVLAECRLVALQLRR